MSRRGSLVAPSMEINPSNRKRKESLKDQLILKLTGKSRTVSIEHGELSPSVQLNVNEEIEEDEGRISPTLSNSSKKTNTSNDMKSTLRGKIREKAQSLVDRSRESAALSRRLERKMTLTTSITSPGDINGDDDTIESAIRRGAVVMKDDEDIRNELSEDIQVLFLTSIHKKEDIIEDEQKVLTSYHGSITSPPIDESILKIYSDGVNRDREEGLNGSNMNWNRLYSRLGVKEMSERWITNNDHFNEIREDMDYLVVYTPAETIKGSTLLDEIELEIGSISFQNHWTFSKEDEIAEELRELYEEHVESGIEVIERIKKGSNDSSDNGLIDAFNAHQTFLMIGKRVEEANKKLIEIRNAQGYRCNPLHYIQGTYDTLSPLSISSLGKLNEVPVELDKVIIEEKKRLIAASNVKIQLVLHYNDILALRTPWKNIMNSSVSFKQKYTLKVHSPPTSITISIIEKYGRKERVLAVLGLSLPQKLLKISFASNDLFPNILGDKLDIRKIVRGMIECSVIWKGEGGTIDNGEIEKNNRPFSLFIRECELEEYLLDDGIVLKRDEDHIREEPMSPIGMILRLERERIMSKNTAMSLRKNLLDKMEDRKPVVEDIIKEESIPTFAIAIGSLFGPTDVSRKLKPMRKDPLRRQVSTSSSYRLIINIQSSRRLPTRKDGSNLRPFVSIRTNKDIYRTPTANGSNANWQYTIIVDGEGDRSDIGNINLEVFDEIIHDLPQDNRLINTRYEESVHHILGSAQICSSSIIQRSKIDSFIRLKTPSYASNYNMDEWSKVYLKVLIAIEPSTILSSYSFSTLQCGETQEILSQCKKWNEECSSLYPDRQFISNVYNSDGKALIATRYLRSLNPPPSIDNLRSNIMEFYKEATKAVSLIPFLKNDSILSSFPHLWCTADQFLSLEYGSNEEHGILLACWCLSMNYPTYLLLGRSHEEHSSIILIHLPNGKIILNPSDGSILSIDDEVVSFWVHTIITPSNIYGNIQPFTHISQINFDLTRKDQWKILLTKEVNLPSIQPHSLQYTMMKEDSIVELRSSLERSLKLRIDESRSFGVPQWNLLTSRSLRESLNTSSTSILDEIISRTQSSFNTSIIVLSTPFVSISHSIDQIISTRLHISSHPHTQFALSISIQNVFNSTVCVTLALAILIPKENFVP